MQGIHQNFGKKSQLRHICASQRLHFWLRKRSTLVWFLRPLSHWLASLRAIIARPPVLAISHRRHGGRIRFMVDCVVHGSHHIASKVRVNGHPCVRHTNVMARGVAPMRCFGFGAQTRPGACPLPARGATRHGFLSECTPCAGSVFPRQTRAAERATQGGRAEGEYALSVNIGTPPRCEDEHV